MTCTWFEVAANKNRTNFSGRARDTGILPHLWRWASSSRINICAHRATQRIRPYAANKPTENVRLKIQEIYINYLHDLFWTRESIKRGGIPRLHVRKEFFLHKTMLWLRILTCHRRHLQQHPWQLGSCSSWILYRTFHIYRDKSSPHHHWDEFCHLSRRGEASILHPWLILLNCRQCT